MKRLLKAILRHARKLAALAALAGIGGGACYAQQQVTKISGGTGSLANTLQADLQVANGRTLTISTGGALVIGSGATVSVSGATFTGSFSLSNVTIFGGTASLSSLTVSGASVLGTVSISSLSVSGTESVSASRIVTATVSGTLLATSPTAGIGYGAGSGSTSTQLTNKSTAVTLNGLTGQITLNSFSMSSAATASFTLTNSAIAATDVIITNANSASYSARATTGGTGTSLFTIKNESAVTASDSPVISFSILRGSAN